MAKHVYILGAGFSVPLGGPLFAQLLTTELDLHCLSIQIPECYRTPVLKLYLDRDANIRGLEPRSIDLAFGRLHRPFDAEELLERLDWVSRNTESPEAESIFNAIRLESPPDGSGIEVAVKLLLKNLKRVIASQCEGFLERLENGGDRLTPYLKWFGQLSQRDTIVTFNYDTAIERISRIVGNPLPTSPGVFGTSTPRLLKLHGSADWFQDGKDVKQRDEAYKEDLDLRIGIPGEGKSSLVNDPFFGSLWQDARNKLSEAEVISILGYSMPATDNIARDWILDAIRDSKTTKKRVNIILGPDSGSIRAKRLVSMIQPLTGGLRVVDIPMYCQEYLSHVTDYATFDFPL